jgi:CheY-like chemotaxis protein
MDLKGATILVADDELDLLEILRRWLEREGAQVLTAANGEAALALLAKNKVDAIVSDVRMPVMDGVEFARRVTAGADHPPILFVSGFADIDQKACAELGITALLPKPVRRQDILDAVRRVLGGR